MHDSLHSNSAMALKATWSGVATSPGMSAPSAGFSQLWRPELFFCCCAGRMCSWINDAAAVLCIVTSSSLFIQLSLHWSGVWMSSINPSLIQRSLLLMSYLQAFETNGAANSKQKTYKFKNLSQIFIHMTNFMNLGPNLVTHIMQSSWRCSWKQLYNRTQNFWNILMSDDFPTVLTQFTTKIIN